MTKSSEKTVIEPRDPGSTAKLFRNMHRPALLNHQDEWLEWTGAAYAAIDDLTIQSEVRKFLEASFVKVVIENRGEVSISYAPFCPSRKDVAEVYDALKDDFHVPPETMMPPCWLEDREKLYAGLDPRNLISCKNGLLDMSTRELYPATPKFFTRTSLDIEFAPEAPPPKRFLSFLNEVAAERQPLIDLLQEMTGYIVSGDTSLQKVFFFRGKRRAGKGTILRILEELIGKRNIATPTIRNLPSQFGMQSLIGKPLAAISDMNCDNAPALSEAGSVINGISGEDTQTIPRKFHTDWIGKVGARFLLISNRMPNFGTNTDALAARLLIVPFDVSFEGREDFELDIKLRAELPGILNWALDGLDRLKARGRFVEPDDSKVAKRNLLYQSNPVHGFVAECCKVGPGTETDKDVLYEAFSQFCRQSGFNSTKVLPKFSQDLQDLFDVTVRRRTADDGRQPGVFVGIRLNDELLPEFFAVNRDLIELGFEAHEALKLDKRGWPMARVDGGADFEL
ncbi:phage/plasmid primase, P4 family [Bradyrhizobium sp. WYCCWR 13023]|uniref:Phage/plasmid primase, P4 family n=1 Tax=Bradyrhizobium zhengyangense TaxID=2911009 RepID=A0A9X1RE74_9BRAD|nr:phage/plasmid primase, P4 family [Bradyrhizobium zhengyangense]MCG2629733.1 phage/plasmid primase, P4 family [Bradyrhizobium zhengyangense]